MFSQITRFFGGSSWFSQNSGLPQRPEVEAKSPRLQRRIAREQKKEAASHATGGSFLPSAKKAAAIFFIFLAISGLFTPVAMAACLAPTGSYEKTCPKENIKAKEYRSSDPKLAKIKFCEFEIKCQKLDTSYHENSILLPEEAVGCLSNYENCDGRLIYRASNVQRCNTTNSSFIVREAEMHDHQLDL